MAIVGSLIVLLGTNNAPLTAGLLAAEGQLKGFGAANASAGRLAAASFAGIGLVAAAGMGLAVRAAADFQEQMAKVNTIAHQTPTELAATGAQIRALSVATGTGLPDLTSSFYDLLSVGVPVGKAMEFLANATTLSIGGLSTSKEAVDAITTSINAWSGATGASRLTMEDSLKVTDLWAKGIEVGGFTAADIGSALSNVAAQASNFNTPLQQVVATTALLTTRGFTASTALTSMDAAFTALQRVPPGMEKLQKSTGKTYETIARTQGIHEAITQIVADAQKFGVGLVDVFGRTDALGYVINTTGTSAKAYEDILTSMYDASGTAAGQAAERSQTLDFQMRVLGASVNDLGITLGTALVPPLTSFVGSLNGAVQGVSAWATANPQLSGTILPIVAGLGALAAAALILGPIFTAAGAVMALALSPVGLVLAALLATAIALQTALNQNNAIAAANPSFTPAQISQEKYNTGTPEYRTAAEKHGYGPQSNFGGPAWGAFNTPGFAAGEPGSPYAGPRTPVTLNHTSVINVDGQKLVEVVDRRQYDMYSVSSSGMSSTDHPHR